MNQTYMKEQKILPLLLKMSLPMVISMMVNSLYNIVDSFFVAKISENAMTALSLVFPIQNLISSVMIGFAIGINAVISFFMGAQNQKQADKAASQGMLLSCIHAVVLTVICIAGMPVFLKMFTKDAEIVSLGLKYSNIAFAFSIMLGIELMFEKVFQAVGRMNASMVCLMTGCIVNIVLDPIFIYVFGMGVKGAALATIISQGVSCLWVLKFLTGKKTVLKIRLKNLVLDGKIVTSVLSLGVSPFIMQATECLIQLTFNNGMLKYGNDLYVALMSILFSLTQLIWMPLNGFSQGAQPVIGYNYGAKRFDRVKKAFKLQFTVSICFSLFAVALVEVFPTAFLKMFTNDQELIDIGINSTRLFLAGMSVMGAQCACQQTFLALGEAKISMFLACLRKIILLFPLALILPNIANMGVWGLLLAEPVSDVVAASCTTIMFTIRSRKILKQ